MRNAFRRRRCAVCWEEWNAALMCIIDWADAVIIMMIVQCVCVCVLVAFINSIRQVVYYSMSASIIVITNHCATCVFIFGSIYFPNNLLSFRSGITHIGYAFSAVINDTAAPSAVLSQTSNEFSDFEQWISWYWAPFSVLLLIFHMTKCDTKTRTSKNTIHAKYSRNLSMPSCVDFICVICVIFIDDVVFT